MNDTTDALLRKKKIERPFLYLSPSAQSVSLVTALLLVLQVLMLAVTKSYGALLVIVCALPPLAAFGYRAGDRRRDAAPVNFFSRNGFLHCDLYGAFGEIPFGTLCGRLGE